MLRKLAIIIAVNAYADDPLFGCVADGEAYAAFRSSPAGGQFEYVITLYDEKATREELLAILRWAAKYEWAEVSLYFAGHGGHRGIELYDGTLPYVRLGRWLRGFPARHRLAVLDSCLSGRLLDSVGLAGLQKSASLAVRDYAAALADACPGLRVITAVDRYTNAQEWGGRGAFTVALLRAARMVLPDLRGRAVSAAKVAKYTRILLAKQGLPLPTSAGSLRDMPFALSDRERPFGSVTVGAQRRLFRRLPAYGSPSGHLVEIQPHVHGRPHLVTHATHTIKDSYGRTWHESEWSATVTEEDESIVIRDPTPELPLGLPLFSIVHVYDEHGNLLSNNSARI